MVLYGIEKTGEHKSYLLWCIISELRLETFGKKGMDVSKILSVKTFPEMSNVCNEVKLLMTSEVMKKIHIKDSSQKVIIKDTFQLNTDFRIPIPTLTNMTLICSMSVTASE
jgi:hypothetical protein